MKKRVVSLFLALVLALSLASTALAVEETTVTSKDPTNVTATLVDDKKVELTVRDLSPNTEYLILMVSGLYTDETQIKDVTASTIRYIDQTSNASGTISATVYPDSLQTSTICISGADTNGLRIVATVEVPYLRGDANLNGNVNLLDATLTARHVVGGAASKLTGNALLAADANLNGNVNLFDATLIAKYVVNKTWN